MKDQNTYSLKIWRCEATSKDDLLVKAPYAVRLCFKNDNHTAEDRAQAKRILELPSKFARRVATTPQQKQHAKALYTAYQNSRFADAARLAVLLKMI